MSVLRRRIPGICWGFGASVVCAVSVDSARFRPFRAADPGCCPKRQGFLQRRSFYARGLAPGRGTLSRRSWLPGISTRSKSAYGTEPRHRSSLPSGSWCCHSPATQGGRSASGWACRPPMSPPHTSGCRTRSQTTEAQRRGGVHLALGYTSWIRNLGDRVAVIGDRQCERRARVIRMDEARVLVP